MNMTIGSAPDSWGVWFPSDPKQTPWARFLDEVMAAGYEWIELGPYGYLPTEISSLRKELTKRNLSVCAATAIGNLEQPSAWPALEKQIIGAGALVAALGAKYLVLIDDLYTDLFTGRAVEPAQLDKDSWKRLVDTVHKAAEIAMKRFSLTTVFHPHAETHVEFEQQIEALLNQTDPNLIGLCLDTGHHAYRGGDPVRFLADHHKRIPYLHLKSVDCEVQKKVKAEHIPFGTAVSMNMFCEPSMGAVNFTALREVMRQIDFTGWGIVEQDMYPAPFDRPLPIAKRTREYLRDLRLG